MPTKARKCKAKKVKSRKGKEKKIKAIPGMYISGKASKKTEGQENPGKARANSG